jgi:hypothetical protein
MVGRVTYGPGRTGGAGVDQRRPLRLPSLPELQYVTTILELFFLLLALPYVLFRLATDPAGLIKGIGRNREA